LDAVGSMDGGRKERRRRADRKESKAGSHSGPARGGEKPHEESALATGEAADDDTAWEECKKTGDQWGGKGRG